MAVISALVIVSLVALVFQSPVAEVGEKEKIPGTMITEIPTPPESTVTIPPLTPKPMTTPPEPFRITYSTDFWDRPHVHLPENLVVYGGSDPLWKNDADIVTFAYVEEKRGGITDVFHVPYPVWRLNCSVTPTIRPESASFKMALVDLENEIIVKGAEFRYPGSIIKNVQRGGKDFYLIVSADGVDSYRISLETQTQYL